MSYSVKCVNLRDLFGDKLRISYDPARQPGEKREQPWLMQIRGRRATIYPYGGSRLAIEVDYHNRVARDVGRIPGVVQAQDGDDEKTFVFDVALFDQVAELVKPSRRRVYTAEQLKSAQTRMALARAKRHRKAAE